jgi:hypothetical protein
VNADFIIIMYHLELTPNAYEVIFRFEKPSTLHHEYTIHSSKPRDHMHKSGHQFLILNCDFKLSAHQYDWLNLLNILILDKNQIVKTILNLNFGNTWWAQRGVVNLGKHPSLDRRPIHHITQTASQNYLISNRFFSTRNMVMWILKLF